ncbi:hypothetical protein IGJ02_002284 [Enterococcus sp. DIV0724b]|uniref:DUF3784 domain-containing protein n=1 Tax=Enterococcus sp. DIV0724b TaxID=2774694 RepID=UPI003D2FDDC8
MVDLIMILIFIICGVQLWRGKWSWLIAGYNTASEQEKAKTNEWALGKVMSIILIISAMLIGLGSLFLQLQLVIAIAITILVGGAIAYINTSPRFKNEI